MSVGDLIKGNSVSSKYLQYLNGYNSYVWHTGNYPTLFPTAYLGTGPINNSIPTPASGDIVSAFLSIANAVKNTARSLTAIVTCRYVLKYNNNGVWRVDFDRTQKALFNAGYLLKINSNLNSGDIVFESGLNAFFNSVKNEVIAAQNRQIYLESTYCHTSCFSEDTLIEIKHISKEDSKLISFKDFDILLDNFNLSDFKVKTPEGFIDIVELFNNGEKDVFLINDKIKCTIDHKFVVDKENNDKKEIGFLLGKEVETINGKEKIDSIVYLGKQNVYDLEVDSDEHRYIVNSSYIVSNCHSNCHGCVLPEESFVNIKINEEYLKVSMLELKAFWKNNKIIEIETPYGYSLITNYFNNGVKKIFKIELDKEVLFCTEDHKIFYSLNECKPLKDFKLGETILTEYGCTEIKEITEYGYFETVDIEVDNLNHNYYCNGILISNSRGRR